MKIRDIESKFANKLINMSIMSTTLGGDPEFFVVDSNGKAMSADTFFPGKNEPLVVGNGAYEERDGNKKEDWNTLKLFFDGIQAEMNIGVNRCRELLCDNIHQCLRKASSIIKKHNDDSYSILAQPSIKVRKSVIMRADPEARRFGCAPDFNAYTGTVNTGEMDATNHPYRYAGGHIHIGRSSQYLAIEKKLVEEEENHIRLVKVMDLIVGILCVLLDNSKYAIIRRSEYGKAGCFRPTPYGIEYRTPSCWWLKSPVLTSLIMGLARLSWSITLYKLDQELFKSIGYSPEDIRGICDESDRKTALKVWENLRVHMSIAGSSKNPLNIKVVYRNAEQVSTSGNPRCGAVPKVVLSSKRKDSVFSLAAVEWLVRKGLKSIISPSIKDEWLIKPKSAFNGVTQGFFTSMSRRFYNNADFSKFQNSFLAEIV